MMYFAVFFAGGLLCNSIPHLIAGLQGMPFQTPFAKPSGVGESSPVVNVLWGFFNLLVGLVLVAKFPVEIGFNARFIAIISGALVLGVFSAQHFGSVRRAKHTHLP